MLQSTALSNNCCYISLSNLVQVTQQIDVTMLQEFRHGSGWNNKPLWPTSIALESVSNDEELWVLQGSAHNKKWAL